MSETASDEDSGVKSIVLTLRILEYLAQQGEPSGVTTIAQALGVNKSRTYRHLRTLVQHGYVTQSQKTELYQAGMRLVTLGRAVSDRLSLASIGRAAISALREDLGHNVVLAQLDPEGLRAVANVLGKSYIEIGVRPGSILAYHGTAQGKIVLAFGLEHLRTRIISEPLVQMTEKTIVDKQALLQEIEIIRRRGWATAPNEGIIGLNALAAPIFDAFGSLIGTVAIVDSVQFIEATPSDRQIAGVMDAARRIGHALGGVET